MRWLKFVAPLALAGCVTLDQFGAISFDGGAADQERAAQIEAAGLDGDLLYVGVNGGPDEFPSRAAAEGFVSQHRGQQAVFRGNIMQVSDSGRIDVAHWQPYGRGRSCIPRSPVASCLQTRGGLPTTVVRCVGPSIATLQGQTAGGINRSRDYPWTRPSRWDTATITGRVTRVTSTTTVIGSGTSVSGEALADFGALSQLGRGATFRINVIELNGCRLAMFNGQAT